MIRQEKNELRGDSGVNLIDEDRGAFIIWSVRHGRRKPLKRGQELLANYNVPDYSPFDWFVSLCFVLPEQIGNWQKVEGHLKRPRTFAKDL